MEDRAKTFTELLDTGIRIYAAAHGLSLGEAQTKLANLMSISPANIQKWRNEQYEYLPRAEYLEVMSREFSALDYFDEAWICDFLEKGRYPNDQIDALIAELFPNQEVVEDEAEANEHPIGASTTTSLVESTGDITPTPALPTVPTRPHSTSTKPKTRRKVLFGVAVAVLLIAIFGAYSTSLAPTSICGEAYALEDGQVGERFLPVQRVIAYTTTNAPNGILDNTVRAVEASPEGVFIGYFHDAVGAVNGVSYYTRGSEPRMWLTCGQPGELVTHLVTDMLLDSQDRLWVASDGNGVSMFDGRNWHHFTKENGSIDSHAVYQIVEFQDDIWAATGEGVAVFDDDVWRLEYESSNELYHNQVRTVAFDENGDIWVGHVTQGISFFSPDAGWRSIRAENTDLSSNNIQEIIVVPEADGTTSVWIATGDNGVNQVHQNQWHTFGVEDGLPDLQAQALAVDRYNRIWVATTSGVAYYDGAHWFPFVDLPTMAIGFTSSCPNDSCPLDDLVWLGTFDKGLIESKLPYDKTAVYIDEVCFRLDNAPTNCVELETNPASSVVTATLPVPVQPNETFFMEIDVVPVNGFDLKQVRGDALIFASDDKRLLAGAYEIIPVSGEGQEEVVVAGDTFTFSNRANRFVAPEPRDGASQETIVSPWRLWVSSRNINPEIRIVFTVEKND